MNADKNYYEILGVAPLAEDVVIKAAYKAMAQKYHPDKFQGNAAEASARMAEINEAYAALTDVELRRTYDNARKNIHSRDVAVSEVVKEEAEQSSLAIQHDNSSTISPSAPKLLVRSLVVGILLVLAGAVMSSVFGIKGGDGIVGLGLMGLGFISLPSFVLWVARGGIKDDLLGKLLRYSFYAIPLLFILGGAIGAFSKKSSEGGMKIVAFGVVLALLMLFLVFVAWIARKIYLFMSSAKSPQSKVETQSSAGVKSDEQVEDDVQTKTAPQKNTWVFPESADVVYFFDEQSQLRIADVNYFQIILTEKRSHFLFDKTVSVAFVVSGEKLDRWIQLSKSFVNLKSSEMFVTTDFVEYSRKEIKEHSGATGYYEHETVKVGHYGVKGVVTRNAKEPLLYEQRIVA